MDPNDIYTPPGGPPPTNPNVKHLFEKWGETNIRQLVSDFYDLIRTSEIRWMFKGDWDLAKEKQSDFLIQVLGGPSYYIEKWGPARMRMRHFVFPISEKERTTWFQCYDEALQKFDFDHDDKIDFLYFLDGFSGWMVNRKEPPWEKYTESDTQDKGNN
ncbi:MAG: bacitracin resistance protein BacA [Leptospira sp.]|uniref:globin domain-containing protein n=1 Tax=Leptospira sp. TaxID=178 RepID=UPI0025BF64A0|nr:bacitracin resistance protein BacA [Leptospira sp.]MBL0953214.1 bacitracin resistance protein BacA [Leptospira sp.]